MNTTILQVPVDKTLRSQALSAAREQGFSSLQDMLRFVLTKFAKKQFIVTVQEPSAHLSKRAEKTYAKMQEDFRSGKNVKRFHSVEGLLNDLDT